MHGACQVLFVVHPASDQRYGMRWDKLLYKHVTSTYLTAIDSLQVKKGG